MCHPTVRPAFIFFAIVGTAAAPLTPGQTQTVATEAGRVLEEVVVTARRYEESFQDAPVSISVLTEDYLVTQRIESMNEVLAQVPGANFDVFNKAQPTFALRGVASVSSGSASAEAGIASVVDGVTITKDSMIQPQLFDLERVEAMRGPQGTAFGRNASIGLIHYITNRPTQEFEAGVTASAGSDSLADVDGFISGPLSNQWSGRLAFNVDTTDGPSEDQVTGESLSERENTAIRGSFLFEPSDTFQAYFKAELQKDDEEAPLMQPLDCSSLFITTADVTPGGNYAQDWSTSCDPWKTQISSDRDFFYKRDISTVMAELTWLVNGEIAVTSITSLLDGDAEGYMDARGSPENLGFQAVTNDVKIVTQEVRIDNMASSDRFRWLAGLYLLHDEEFRGEDNVIVVDNPVPGGFPPSIQTTDADNQTDSVALFGELNFDLSDRLALGVGGRYTEDERDQLYYVRCGGGLRFCQQVAGCVEAAVNGTCGTIDNPIIGLDGHPTSGDWSDFSGKVSLRYALSDASSLYFLYSEGFKSGGFQFNALNAEQLSVVYDSETSQNVEIGWKTGTDRWIGAVTLFALAIDDQQFPNFVPVQGGNFVSVTTNLGGMESTGLELEGTWLVTDSFLLGGNLAVIDSEIVDSVVISGFDSLGNPSFVDASGIVPWGVPEETGTLYGEYTFGLGNGSEITLRADYWHRGEAWFGNTDRTNPDLRRPEIDQVGARVTWTSATEQTRVALWGSNLGDEIDQLSWGAGFQTLQTPKIIGGKKEYGVTVSHRF